MYSVSDRFLTYINRSGRRKTVADILFGGQTIISDVPIVSGNISYDRNSDVRASGSIQFADRDIDWTNLDPLSREIKIRTGVVYPDGTEELVPLGVFRLEDYTITESSLSAPVATFYDRAKLLYDLVGFAQIGSNRTASFVVNEINGYALAGMHVTVHFNITDFTFPNGTSFPGTDADTLTTIADTVGADWWFDRSGDLWLDTKTVISSSTTVGDAVYTFAAGINLVSTQLVKTRDGFYNGVIVYGNGGVFGEAYTADYWGPFFGKKVLSLNLPGLSTREACTSAAEANLAKVNGLVNKYSFKALLNPALDIADIIAVIDTTGVVRLLQVETIKFDFSTWDMEVTGKAAQ